jgi:hypothetical protein
MTNWNWKQGTIASSLLLACSLVLAGAAVVNAAAEEPGRATPAWGLAVPLDNDSSGEPSPTTAPDEQVVAPADSAWG